jgi:hypothetical protein
LDLELDSLLLWAVFFGGDASLRAIRLATRSLQAKWVSQPARLWLQRLCAGDFSLRVKATGQVNEAERPLAL